MIARHLSLLKSTFQQCSSRVVLPLILISFFLSLFHASTLFHYILFVRSRFMQNKEIFVTTINRLKKAVNYFLLFCAIIIEWFYAKTVMTKIMTYSTIF